MRTGDKQLRDTGVSEGRERPETEGQTQKDSSRIGSHTQKRQPGSLHREQGGVTESGDSPMGTGGQSCGS